MPNTLTQLNNFSNESLPFEDQRPYNITFSANATTNQNVTTSEDSAFTSPVGINITSVISQPGNITYNINTSNIGGNAILSWPALPNSVSSSTPSLGVYRITGVMDEVIWDQIKNPTIIAKDLDSNFTYSANIQYPSTANTALTNTWSWTNSVTISNTHGELSNATGFTYDEDVPMTIPGTPTITDTYAGLLPYTLVISPNIPNAVFSLAMSGNTSLDPVTKALTIVDTKANINTGLGNLYLIPGPDTNLNYSINYSLTNPVSNLNTQVNQAANIGNTETDFTMTTAYNYAEDVGTRLIFAIDDGDTTATSFTISVDQTLGTDGIFLVNGSNFGLGNLASFTGNRTAFNSANITFLPYPDTTDTINITANVYKTNGVGNITVASNVVSTLTNTSSHEEYSLTTNYNYSEDNTVNLVFDVLDTDPLATSYTVTFDQSLGEPGVFFVNGVSQGVGNAAVFTGSKANVNSANISFLPYPDDTSSLGITYTQSKNNSEFGNITQVLSEPCSLTCTVAHADSSFAAGSYTEDTNLSFVNLVLDQDPNATSYTISLQQMSGDTGTWFINGVNMGNATNVYTVSDTKTGINSLDINFRPAIDSTSNVTFRYNQSKINSIFGEILQVVDQDEVYTCGTTNPEISNLIGVTRSYTGNTVNNVFSTSTPVIDDGPDYGQIYTITLSSDLGKFGNSAANAIASSSYTFTGNTTQVNNEFALMKFVPNIETSSSGTFNYTQSRNAQSQINATVNLNGTPGPDIVSTYTFAQTGSLRNFTWTPTFEESYYGVAEIFLVGGGGGGGRVDGLAFTGLQSFYGGAGGDIVLQSGISSDGNISLSQTTYNIEVGAGGTNPDWGPGSSSTFSGNGFTTLTAGGGYNAAGSGDRSLTTEFNVSSPAGSFGYGSLAAAYDSPSPTPSKPLTGGAPGAGSSGTNPATGTDYTNNIVGIAGDGYLYNGNYYAAGGKSLSWIKTGPGNDDNQTLLGPAGLGWRGNVTYPTTGAGSGGDTGILTPLPSIDSEPGMPGIIIIRFN